MSGLEDRRTLVLGGSRGIGAAIVRRSRTCGATVTSTYASARESAGKTAAETGSFAVRIDSADRDALIEAVGAAGPPDVPVASAGVAEGGDPPALSPDAVDRPFAINTHAPHHAAVEAAGRQPVIARGFHP